MKHRYFLRGLGTGLILASLILCISYRSGKSGENVVEKAKELGMVFPEGTQPPDSIPEETPAPVTADPVGSGAGVIGEEIATPEPPSAVEPEVTPEPPPVVEPEVTPEPSPVAQPEVTPEPAPKATKKPEATKKPSSTTNTKGTVRFKVRSGLLSSTVAREMREAGIIKDDKKFDDFLEKNGYSKLIREGIYMIPRGASYQDIAKIITKQK